MSETIGASPDLGNAAAAGQGGPAKNVILLITDGASHNTWDAASYYRHGELGREAYDGFDTELFMSTFPLTTSSRPTNSLEGPGGYDPARAWLALPQEGVYDGRLRDYPDHFLAYDYLRQGVTDSAAAGTAIASGVKTYNNAINVDNFGNPVPHIGELVVEAGKELGIVTSVYWSHATPAAFGAQNLSRNNYAEIARQMVEEGLASVIMGGGHPFFDHDGRYRTPDDEDDFQYVGGPETFVELITGQTAYRFIDSLEEFEALADGLLELGADEKLLGTFRTAATLQFNRDGEGMGNLVGGVPDLPTMTRGALNVLSDDPDGFFLMVEGGAVDWAAHANDLPRVIEEQIDFNRAVEVAVAWVEANSSWEETLVVVTTDHGNGLLLGPDSGERFFQPIVNQGAGALPLGTWHTDNHTNELVRLFAKGAGTEAIAARADQVDHGLGFYGVPEEGRVYLDNTELFEAMVEAMGLHARAGAGAAEAVIA
jgi:alkaline phosphatase